MIRGLVTIIFFLTNCSLLFSQSVIDLSKSNFENKVYFEKFNWNFYWETYLPVNSSDHNKKPISLSDFWSNEHLSSVGFGTYQTRLLLPKEHSGLSIFIPVIFSAYNVWVNGQLSSFHGNLYFDGGSGIEARSTTIKIPANVAEVNLIIHVRNYSRAYGGISTPIIVGKEDRIVSSRNVKRGIDLFLVGTLFTMAFFKLILFILSRQEKSNLYLFFICAIVGVRALIKSQFLVDLFEFVRPELWEKLEFIVTYSILILFPLYIKSMLPLCFPKPIFILIGFISLGMITMVMVTTEIFFVNTLSLFQSIMIVELIYVIAEIWKNRNEGKLSVLMVGMGLLFSSPFFLIEYLNYSGFNSQSSGISHLAEAGTIVFLGFQCFSHGVLNSKAKSQLSVINSNLEALISEKTFELTNSNEMKDRLLSIISHDLKSPINALKGILKLARTDSSNHTNFFNYCADIEKKLEIVSHLTENILYWSSNQLNGFTVKYTQINVHELVNQHLQLFEDLADQKKIKWKNLIPIEMIIYADMDILSLALRNIISNAVKFSKETGEIVFRAIQEEQISLLIKDSGDGIPWEVSRTLFAGNNQMRTINARTDKGTGIGLKLSKIYLEKMGAGIHFETSINNGTTFTISKLATSPNH
jgi:signal transduction histidine kinase